MIACSLDINSSALDKVLQLNCIMTTNFHMDGLNRFFQTGFLAHYKDWNGVDKLLRVLTGLSTETIPLSTKDALNCFYSLKRISLFWFRVKRAVFGHIRLV